MKLDLYFSFPKNEIIHLRMRKKKVTVPEESLAKGIARDYTHTVNCVSESGKIKTITCMYVCI